MVIIHSFVRSSVHACIHSFKHGFVHPSIAWGVNVSTKKIPVIKQRPIIQDFLRRIPGGEGEDGQDALEVAAGEVCHVLKKKTTSFEGEGINGPATGDVDFNGCILRKVKILLLFIFLLKNLALDLFLLMMGTQHRRIFLCIDTWYWDWTSVFFLWSVSRWICWWDSNLNSSGVHGLHLPRGLVNVLTAGRTCDTMHWKVVWTCFLTQDNKEQQNLKILEMARMWKKRKLESSQ